MIPIYIAGGDPNGIGPEVTLKALSLLAPDVREHFVLSGHFRSLSELNRLLGTPLKLESIQSLTQTAPDGAMRVLDLEGVRSFQPSYGRVSADAGTIAGRGIMCGVEACRENKACAIVTAPASKESLNLAGFAYPGQTEMIASLIGAERHIMILAGQNLRVGLATTHLALRHVSKALRPALVLDKILALQDALKTWFAIAQPVLAIAALNPHASDGGIFGSEEKEIISPAIEEARQQGVIVEGPLPADSLFPRWRKFDGILAMYHDQGMIPIKMIAQGEAINMTSGLPFPRTSPDHGTAFDIAGKLIADPRSMLHALKTAYALSKRMAQSAAAANVPDE